MGLGRSLILMGGLLVLAGAVVLVWSRLGWPRLPGDIVIRRGGFSLFLPLASSLLLSVILTLVLNWIGRRH